VRTHVPKQGIYARAHLLVLKQAALLLGAGDAV
jgi:hypothetical protein